MAKVKIKLIKSVIGHPKNQKLTAKALGLTKMQKEVIKPNNSEIQGMIKTIAHLVKVQEVNNETT